MRYTLRALGRNLIAGLRLALFLPVTRLAFRVDAVQLLLLFVLSCAIDVGGDWLRMRPDAAFSIAGVGGELVALALLVLMALLVALALRRPPLALAFRMMLATCPDRPAMPRLAASRISILSTFAAEVRWARSTAPPDLLATRWPLISTFSDAWPRPRSWSASRIVKPGTWRSMS